MTEITTTPALRSVPVLADVSAVVVRTMKKKFVEQLPSYKEDIPERLTVLGTSSMGAIVICKAPNGQLCKVHCTDFQRYLVGVGVPYSKEAYEAASRTIAGYPQIFED